MGFYEDNIVPRIVNLACGRKDIAEHRRELAAGLTGAVVEIGFGSGLNVPYYPTAVTKVLAVDPSEVGRKLAAERLAASPVPVEFAGLDGQELPFESASLDAALSTFTLCTIPDVKRALAEVRRVLRPGARFHFLEHGLCPDPKVARWQHRLTPLQRRLCGGCHFNRAVDQLVTEAGFEITDLRNDHLAKVPRTVGYLYQGTAVAPG
jgi:ubiquinone/menaquinone biosynthesis C-methylase UbiE